MKVPAVFTLLLPVCVAAAAFAAPAAAQTAGAPVPASAAAAPIHSEPVQVRLAAFKVIQANGQESFVKADQAAPGDVIEYRAIYLNTGKTPVHGVLATVPVPDGTRYVDRSAQPAAVMVATASSEDSPYAAAPLQRQLTGADGRTVAEPVPLDDYRSLRWQLGELQPGKSRSVSARVEVIGPAAAAPATQTASGE